MSRALTKLVAGAGAATGLSCEGSSMWLGCVLCRIIKSVLFCRRPARTRGVCFWGVFHAVLGIEKPPDWEAARLGLAGFAITAEHSQRSSPQSMLLPSCGSMLRSDQRCVRCAGPGLHRLRFG